MIVWLPALASTRWVADRRRTILPPTARYLCCTVESMPVEPLGLNDVAGRRFDFVAVDEVQLAGDRERGHIFTDRILARAWGF